MLFLISNVLVLAAAFILLVILYNIPGKKSKQNRFLIFLLSLMIAYFTCQLFYLLSMTTPYLFEYAGFSIIILFGPTLYFYVRALTNNSAKNSLLHFSLLVLGLWVIFLLDMLKEGILASWTLTLYYCTVLLFYFAKTLQFGFPRKDAWVLTLIRGFSGLIILFLLEAVALIIPIGDTESVGYGFSLACNILSFLFLIVSIKQLVSNPSIVSHMKIQIPYRHDKSSVSQTELNLIVSNTIQNSKFRDPDLSRNTISEITGISVHRISEIVNSEFEKNFKEWVNDYRIEAAMLELQNTKVNVQEVYFNVGFNSKSSFYKEFKKRTGYTPKEYRSSISIDI